MYGLERFLREEVVSGTAHVFSGMVCIKYEVTSVIHYHVNYIIIRMQMTHHCSSQRQWRLSLAMLTGHLHFPPLYRNITISWMQGLPSFEARVCTVVELIDDLIASRPQLSIIVSQLF